MRAVIPEFRDAPTDLWKWFWSLPYQWRRMVVAGAVFVIGMTIVFWQFMLPILLFALLVAIYLRFSRGTDALMS